ncbi:GNAT family protein [Rothia sp. LK2588]|uniref:GNAT family N-acetyltransferase n=1 Tax=Rothia sp. LK2588 TaxID=3114369 RepID=UPI0034D01E6B
MSTPSPFLPKPTLTSRLIELRPFDDEAITAILEILADPVVLMKTGSVHSEGAAHVPHSIETYRRWYHTRNEQPDRLDLAIWDKQRQEYVGEVVFNEYNGLNRSVNYRIAIGERGRGRGLGTEATQLMINYGFQDLNLNRIELEVYEFNERARYVYTSCGFVTEGRRRQALYYNGEFHDALIKSIIRSEWEENRSLAAMHTAKIPKVTL